jgi:toxin secretion/phage lysis holin
MGVPPGFTFNFVLISARKMVDNPFMEAFLLVVLADMFLGFFKSFFPKAKKKVDSTTGLQGAIKHLAIMILILFSYPLIDAVGFTSIANTVLVFYIGQYGVSIMENLEVMGVPFPDFIKERFKKMAVTDKKEKKGD